MANRFFNPNEQFCDATGAPYAGGFLAFFASGTSTPLNTYSDSALSIPNTNPVVLDSAGRANSIFLQNLAYKVVLSDVNNNQIWTEDPVYASDYSTRAKLLTGFGSPNGNTAGTAGSAGIGADTYWDATNNILYVCTQTGTSSTAVWTAVNAASTAAIVPQPQGRLTLTSGTPVLGSDVIGATAIIYTPYTGNIVPIYNGSSFVPTVFSELTLTLASQHAASTIYDVFIFNNSGVLTLVTGPAWTTSSLGSGVRGTGAGTTQLSRVNGLLVNTVQITARNGATTYTVNANLATYLGTILIDTTNGQISCTVSYGQSRTWSVWNAYNREPISMLCGDSTANWTYGSSAIRPSNNNAANALTVLTGLAEEWISIAGSQLLQVDPAGVADNYEFMIGINSGFSPSGQRGSIQMDLTATGIAGFTAGTVNCAYELAPVLGGNKVNLLERSASSRTGTFYGGQAHMQMVVRYRG